MPLSPPPALGTSMLPAGTFAGKTVIVTGGGTGLGKGIALEFARLGARVAIMSRAQEHIDEGVAAVEALGARAFGVSADVRVPEQIAAAFDAIERELGPITSLVNNAAGNFPVPAEKLSPNGWRSVVQIVLDGTYFCSRELAIRRIADRTSASIVNITATYAWTGGPGTAHSAAAKAGVTNLTQSLAVEWAPDDIRVNGIAPGLFLHEDQRASLTARLSKNPAGTVPAGRTGEVRELGWAATYLCSPFASYISGHILVVDGANWLRRSLHMPQFTSIRDQFGQRLE